MVAFLPLLWSLCGAPTIGPDYPTQADYLRILQRFPRYAERGWHDHTDPTLGWFGDGRSDENGQRTLANFTLVYAWLATRPKYDPRVSGVPLATVRQHALQAIRHRLRTHVTGDLKCTDEKPWGNHWQSAWWVSRMMPAVDLLAADLTADDLRRVEAMVVHEADRHRGLPPRVGEYGDTKSEENAWDSEVLAWALNRYPQHPHADGWRQAFHTLCLNTLSTAADAQSSQPVAGQPLSEWVGGACIHDDFTIENHGWFHICYMVCPQHSFAWDYYAFRKHGRQPLPTIYHNLRPVWERTKQFWLWDNRFAYVGGKDWPRYAYGMYFVLPALVHMQQVYGDRDARLIEQRRVAAFEQEQLHHNDGSFFSGRFTNLQMTRWPSEWETDCAANLTIAALLHELQPAIAPSDPDDLARRNEGTFVSPESKLVTRRDPQRFASWCWNSHAGPITGLICSDRGEHMLEWDKSLCGEITLAGARARTTVESSSERAIAGGFESSGTVAHGLVASGPSPYRLAVVDDNVPCDRITVPTHPIFTTPHAVPALTGLSDLDSLTAAGAGWTVLATNRRGGPSLLEAKIGQGSLLLSMTNVEERSIEGDPTATKLWGNILAYTRARDSRCGYLAGEAWVKQALLAAKVPFTEIRNRNGYDLRDCDVVFVDRTAKGLIGRYHELLAFVQRGGRVFHSIVQDTDWSPDTISPALPVAVRQFVKATALPDGRSLLVLSAWRAERQVEVRALDPLRWVIANDLFNGGRRLLRSADATCRELLLLGPGGSDAVTSLRSRWLSVDDDLALLLPAPRNLRVRDLKTRIGGPKSIGAAIVSIDPPEALGQRAAGEVLTVQAALLRTRLSSAQAAAAADAVAVVTTPTAVIAHVKGAAGQQFTTTLELPAAR
ncbi:MAG: hypothetical protein IT204_23670 [Fimbriimonadaceae bacterium]|nr:hypothetical protein [Fimbriimonadaceae bacterium]